LATDIPGGRPQAPSIAHHHPRPPASRAASSASSRSVLVFLGRMTFCRRTPPALLHWGLDRRVEGIQVADDRADPQTERLGMGQAAVGGDHLGVRAHSGQAPPVNLARPLSGPVGQNDDSMCHKTKPLPAWGVATVYGPCAAGPSLRRPLPGSGSMGRGRRRPLLLQPGAVRASPW